MVVPVLSAAVAWHSLPLNYFNGDDFFHLYNVATKTLGGLLTEVWGGHFLVVYNLLYLAMFRLFGPNPSAFFACVLATHVANTALLYLLIRRSTGDVRLACFGATLWATCPVLNGALGWYSVYGQVALTAIVLGVLTSLGRAAAIPATPLSSMRAAGWALALALGCTAFGMGLGIAVAFPLAAVLVLPDARASRQGLIVLATAAAMTFAAYELVISHWYVPVAPSGDLSLPTMLRALPQALVLYVYLVGFGAAALLFDLLGRSEQWPAWSAAAGGGVLSGLLVAGWIRGTPRLRRCLAASSFLVLAVYAAVAVGRAYVYEQFHVSSAVAAASPRYHYLATALLAVVVMTAIAGLDGSPLARRAVATAATVAVALRLALLLAFPVPIDHWDEQRAEATTMIDTIHREVAKAPPGAVVTIPNRPFGPSRFLPGLMPGWAGMFVVFFPDDVVDGRPVRFLASSDADWRVAQERGGRIAELVVRAPAGASPLRGE
jgi:hypothetical protein